MKSQKHNQGELRLLSVKIEKEVVQAIEHMAEYTKRPVDELVVIALKRFCSSHTDYLGLAPRPD